MCVCVCGWMGDQKHLYPPCFPQVGVTQYPTYLRSMGNLVPGGRNSVLNWVLKLNHLFIFSEVLNLVFACICNEKDQKVIKVWNNSDTSVLYSIKGSRCGSMIYFHACSLSAPPPPPQPPSLAIVFFIFGTMIDNWNIQKWQSSFFQENSFLP